MKKLLTILISVICVASTDAQTYSQSVNAVVPDWNYIGLIKAYEYESGGFWQVPSDVELYSKIKTGNTVYMVKIWGKEYIASRNTGQHAERYAYIAGGEYYFNINQAASSASNPEIITITAEKSTPVNNGEIGETWVHAPLQTIIYLNKKEVLIQDFMTREFNNFKIIDIASRDAGEVGILLDKCFLAIDLIGKDMRIILDENTCIVQTDIKIK